MPLIQSSVTYLKIFKEIKLCESLPSKLKRTGHTNYAVKPNNGALILASVASFSAFRPREQNLDEAGSDEAPAPSALWNFLSLSFSNLRAVRTRKSSFYQLSVDGLRSPSNGMLLSSQKGEIVRYIIYPKECLLASIIRDADDVIA